MRRRFVGVLLELECVRDVWVLYDGGGPCPNRLRELQDGMPGINGCMKRHPRQQSFSHLILIDAGGLGGLYSSAIEA